MKKKILFMIHDLGHGGAEKVLVNLVNNMDPEKFDISVTAIFGGGVNEKFLKPHVHFRAIYSKMFPGNSHLMKLLTPKQLHKMYIKEHYDIEIAYLEGPASRIISGCTDPTTKTVFWIHCTMQSEKHFGASFRSTSEAVACYSSFNHGVFVSKGVMEAFRRFCPMKHMSVLYNTNETKQILELAAEPVPEHIFRTDEINLIGVGKLVKVKGFDRLIRIHSQLKNEGYPLHTYILGEGEGEEEKKLRSLVLNSDLSDSFTFLGYQTNPYKYVANSDLFVCSSHSEGFSTAVTEALVLGTPVITTRVSGMDELLGDSEFGLIVDNNEDSLYNGIKRLLDNPDILASYKEIASIRGQDFSTERTTHAVENFFCNMTEE